MQINYFSHNRVKIAIREARRGTKMLSPCLGQATGACFHGCCSATSLLAFADPPKPKDPTTSAASRSNFAVSTTSSIFPDTHFTNHESLPSLPEAFSNFTEAYPQYAETEQADRIRTDEFYNLTMSNQVCLDYIGFGLFSRSQHQTSSATASTSSPPPRSPISQSCFFDISYNAVSLSSQILYGTQETPLESAIRRRVMGFLKVSEEDYGMVCTANTASAFKLLAESYSFQTNPRLLTVYDHESEAVSGMVDVSRRRGATASSASFSWPGLRINSAKLRKMVAGNRGEKKRKGLFAFPLQSRMTGSRYSYLWMSLAREKGWHVLLDACALGPKDMDTLGLSLFKPDFLICSFFKVFGENPSGFGCLFVKKSISSTIEASTVARSIGIVSIVPARHFSDAPEDSSGTDFDSQILKSKAPEEIRGVSGALSSQTGDGQCRSLSSSRRDSEAGETSELQTEIVEFEKPDAAQTGKAPQNSDESFKIECRGLDQADSLGLVRISCRVRFLINWLVIALLKLRHPCSENGHHLVKIYGPKIKFERGPAVSFNLFDWKGEKIEPTLVQKLADRNNISLSYGFLKNIWFSEKYEQEKQQVLENRTNTLVVPGGKKREKFSTGITVVSAAVGFLNNFEDAYRLWVFVAKFLDADFVEKERWRYVALNQKTMEV